MITDYHDGRRERLTGLSGEQLAAELLRKSTQADQIERMVVTRDQIRTPEGEAFTPENRHERRRRARQERRQR